ncbi:hypothetical protein LCGC14_2316390 [marine sediment metagenome]|uniref:Uncharacterized protein n=1 Tax=marine sediment metagenome TaxID=412755 RepID=A0A0F9CJQ7_9ZZZZ
MGLQNLINSKEVKSFILKYTKDTRKGWDCTRVSGRALNVLNAKLMVMIQKAVKAHPTRGKTFINIQ